MGKSTATMFAVIPAYYKEWQLALVGNTPVANQKLPNRNKLKPTSHLLYGIE